MEVVYTKDAPDAIGPYSKPIKQIDLFLLQDKLLLILQMEMSKQQQ